MKKEALSLDKIKKDLKTMVEFQINNTDDWRLSFIIPITLSSVIVGILLKNVWIGLLIFSFAAYHIVRYVMGYRVYKGKKNAIETALERGDIAISVEELSHIAEETIYEPHLYGKRARSTKTVTFFYFASGGSWRLPDIDKHYAWSKEFYMSAKGLENSSLSGDTFFRISLQGHSDIAYVYPCKFFTLDSQLELKS